MGSRNQNRSPFLIFVTFIVLGIVGGAVGGGYFFFVANSDDGADDIPIVPPGVTQVASVNTDATADSIVDQVPGGDVNNVSSQAQNFEFPHLLIPSAELDQIIVTSYLKPDGWEIAHLRERVGHLEGTAWTDKPGNIVLAGHVELADGKLGAFGKIDHMQVGDDVMLTEKGVTYHYVVTVIHKVDSSDLSVVYPTEKESITLITCSDYNFFSDKYETRLVVVAEKVQ